MPNKSRRFVLLGASALTLSACGDLLGPPQAPQIYVLRAAPPAAVPAPGAMQVPWGLAINRPDASDSLDTARIALAKSDTQLDYYANATWPDRLTSIVQTSLLAGFQNSGRIAGVAREEDALHADYTLYTDIRDFQAHYSGVDDKGAPTGIPTATLTIVAQMAHGHSRKIVSVRTETQSVAASANSVDAVVQAFDAALGAAVSGIVEWALALPAPEANGGSPLAPEANAARDVVKDGGRVKR